MMIVLDWTGKQYTVPPHLHMDWAAHRSVMKCLSRVVFKEPHLLSRAIECREALREGRRKWPGSPPPREVDYIYKRYPTGYIGGMTAEEAKSFLDAMARQTEQAMRLT